MKSSLRSLATALLIGSFSFQACGGDDSDDVAPRGGASGDPKGKGGASSAGAGPIDTGGVPADAGSGGSGEEPSAQGGKSVSTGGRGNASGGSTGPATNTGGDASVAGSAGAAGTEPGPVGSVPPELVGVWQQTRASAGEYENSLGENFTLTSGFNVQLKISSNGAYYFVHFASGASQTCETVSYMDQSVGSAVLEGNKLTLRPTQRRVDVTDCQDSGSRTLPNDPIEFVISLEDTRYFYGNVRTYRMRVEGGPHPIDLMLALRPPTFEPEQPEQPSNFELGEDSGFQEFQGLWVPSDGTDSDFFNTSTGDVYFPELNGSPHQYLRFAGDAYEAAVSLQNVNTDGPCKMDVIYYENGSTRFALLEDVGDQHNHFVGHVRLAATEAAVVYRIRECDENDGTVVYEVPAGTSYYRFIYFSPERPPESFSLLCEFPLSEWQGTLCASNSAATLHRRE